LKQYSARRFAAVKHKCSARRFAAVKHKCSARRFAAVEFSARPSAGEAAEN
jgi:hypothetical protein